MTYSTYTERELIELYEERASIRQYDGGMTRIAAEKAAYWDWRRIVGPGVSAPEYIRKMARGK